MQFQLRKSICGPINQKGESSKVKMYYRNHADFRRSKALRKMLYAELVRKGIEDMRLLPG